MKAVAATDMAFAKSLTRSTVVIRDTTCRYAGGGEPGTTAGKAVKGAGNMSEDNAHAVWRPLAVSLSQFTKKLIAPGMTYDPVFVEVIWRDLNDGPYPNPTDEPSWFSG
jgi:hypothetical protein